MTKLITHELLKQWHACEDGYEGYCKLFPKGATLEDSIKGLDADGHPEWSDWLFFRARESGEFEEETKLGHRNTGDRNTGDSNTGDSNTGDSNTGHRNTGDSNTGHWNTGHWNTGHRNTGHRNTGDRNTGHRNTGDRNTGDSNTGDSNTGHRNTGDRNTGDSNTGDSNTGDSNTGHWNTGHWNTGHRNTGDSNTGHWNTGHWNTGHRNTGFFNTMTPDIVLAFNKECKREDWNNADIPNFLYNINVTYWVPESEMTDEDKKADPNFYVRCGQLRKRSYHEACKLAWDSATKSERTKVKKLPNFDAAIFKEITGIDVEQNNG